MAKSGQIHKMGMQNYFKFVQSENFPIGLFDTMGSSDD